MWLRARSNEAATRIVPDEPAPADSGPAAPEPGEPQRSSPFDPTTRATDLLLRDPIYAQIAIGKWRDRQARGRLEYDAMLKHPEVAAAYHSRLALIRSHKPHYKARGDDPSPTRKAIAEYSNHVVSLLDWPKFVDGPVGNAFLYGFSITEYTTRTGRWRGRTYTLPDRIVPLPQASLDTGFVPREELGELNLSADPRYNCFSFNPDGTIRAVHQYVSSSPIAPRRAATWEGDDLASVLHFKHNGGDGNPYGESILFYAYYPWADLYTVERIESVFADGSLPWVVFSYKTKDGIPNKAMHDELLTIMEEQELGAHKRTIILPDATAMSVAPSNPAATEFFAGLKKEKVNQIWRSMLVPQSVVAEAGEREADARNLIHVYFKYLIRSDLDEVAAFVDDLVRRLVRANFSNLDEEDFAEPRWSIVLDNDLRVAQGILTQIMPDIHRDKQNEVLKTLFGWWERDFIAADSKDSVAARRQELVPDEVPPGAPGTAPTPPPKEPGEVRRRTDGQTDNPSTSMDTEAES